jgi:tetratricopeptide (TPR) repeat protein
LRPAWDDPQLLLGLLLQQTGDVPAAIAQYRAVLKRNPKSAEAHNWLGVAFMQKNQLPEAIAELRAAVKLNPTLVRAWNNLGSTLAQAGDLAEGIAAFREGLKQAPQDLQLRLNLGTALRTSGDSASAVAELQAVLKQDPNNPEIHYQVGLALREKGEPDAALRELESAVTLDPEYREGYYALGQTLRQVSAATRGKAATPQAQAAVAEGLALAKSGNLSGAIEALKRAAALSPDSAEVQFHLGAALWYSGDRAGAAGALDQAITREPAAGPAYSLRGLVYRESGDLAAAQRMFQRAIALTPNLPVGYLDLGIVLLRRGQLTPALGMFEAGLNLPAPSGAPSDLDVAIRELRGAMKGRESAEAHHVLGRMLGFAGADARQVMASFEAALRMKPDFAEVHNHLGLVYMQAGDDAKAIAAFRESIRLRPGYADAHSNLGAILTATDPVESVRELEKAVELQPGLLKARYNLAIAYGSSPKHGTDMEIAELGKLIALQADYPRAEFALGKALLRKGSVAEAIQHLETAAKADPQFGEAQYQLGLALSRAGRAAEGAKWLKQGRELIANSQRDQTVLLDLSEGKRALEKGELDQAVAKFRNAVRQRPDLAEAHYQLGMALARKQDAAAGDALRKALQLDPAHAAAKAGLEQLTGNDGDEIANFENYIRAGRFAEVQPMLEAYVKQHPKAARAWYALGYLLFTQKKIGDSINALAKSLALDVRNADAHNVLGRNLMLIGRFDAARREFEMGEKYAPRSAEMPFNLGRLFSIQDQWAEAKAAFERALAIEPEYAEAWDGLGFAQEALGDDTGALASYHKAAKLNEERNGHFATPSVNLSAFHNRAGNPDLALEYARKAVAINEKADRGWFQLARAHERKGELDAAVQALNRAIGINPKVASYYYVLSAVYRRLGRQQESRQAMETFSKLDRETNELERKRREGLRAEAPAQ